ncbi:MAG: ABC transporter ATP-binding protein [Caenispirillum sp.]|nr:ABC transporter ATP-binding protein [Caenispirillum sp.]
MSPTPRTDADRAESAPPTPRLALHGITKVFPGTIANQDVSLSLLPGEIHALLGENGAGKSTLVKIVYGLLQADAGEIRWEGAPTVIASPAEARRLGIGMVFQHFSLFDSLTVAENVALGTGDRTPMRQLEERIRDVSTRYGLPLDPRRPVHALSVGERQRVEIVRCLLQDPRLLIMDEPTSVLTPQEAEQLFETLRRLREEGRTILYISHKLEEIRVLCDRATILRAGKVVDAVNPREKTARQLAQAMIGSDFATPARAAAAAVEAPRGDGLLEVERLNLAAGTPFGTTLVDVSLSLHPGEILGIAGVAGNGQFELLSALSGETLVQDARSVRIAGAPAGHLDPRRRRELGLGFVPEERLGRGAVPDMSLAENALLSRGGGADDMVSRGLISFRKAHGLAERIISAYNVVAGNGARATAKSLSGGNLQKFIIGREIMRKPRILIAAHPTWGVDAGAAAAIHQALLDLRDQGTAVLIVSQDLDELFVLSDRIAVMSHGRLSESRPAHEATVEQIGLLMGGVFETSDAWEADTHAH